MAVIRVPLNVTAECINITLNVSLLKNTTTNYGLSSKDQQQALYYILAVLGMYSLGVLVMMVKYLKREQKELEEERRLEEFMRDLRQKSAERRAKSKKPTGMTSRLALSALNTVHALSPPNSRNGKVTFI